MSGRRSRQTTSSTRRCPACSAPTLTEWVGSVAALQVTAELIPLSPAEQAARRTPHSLIWCLYKASPFSAARLRWIHSSHPADCPHPHVAEHHCAGRSAAPAPEPDTLF